ncbi:protein SENESCENCE-ASSOCIATED GENE 21, mitochondrial-like [Phragmites australis]|uniref:protein SENESCENCE-ASSOCIATED GENE 21, mitochondrial-like n=1 Tax=Phragmites australis TaxID=29695 RepID=UPI002D771850|nr:protein SENESCENCE-ASSOCIATED GENE 21, mitochondrial-like [Phragmites australis]
MDIVDAPLDHNQTKQKNLAAYHSCLLSWIFVIMSKISSVVSGLFNRRCYGVYARAVNVHVTASAAAERADHAAADGGRATNKKDVFWMRDPKTGCWAPENRFEEVDAVELRNRLLHHK